MYTVYMSMHGYFMYTKSIYLFSLCQCIQRMLTDKKERHRTNLIS